MPSNAFSADTATITTDTAPVADTSTVEAPLVMASDAVEDSMPGVEFTGQQDLIVALLQGTYEEGSTSVRGPHPAKARPHKSTDLPPTEAKARPAPKLIGKATPAPKPTTKAVTDPTPSVGEEAEPIPPWRGGKASSSSADREASPIPPWRGTKQRRVVDRTVL